jgi:predicted O-methyltransferase YrrM
MNPERRAIADEVFAAGREHDAAQSDRVQRFRNLEPETGELLGILVRATRARRALEIGTSNGYSTLWLGDAVEATSGQLLTLELDPRRTELARENLERAALSEVVQCRTAVAARALSEQPDAAWDLVFLDAERPEYPGYWRELRRVMAPGATLAIDNAISHEPELTAFRRVLDEDPGVESALVPIGAGLIVAVLDVAAAA